MLEVTVTSLYPLPPALACQLDSSMALNPEDTRVIAWRREVQQELSIADCGTLPSLTTAGLSVCCCLNFYYYM